MRQSLAVAVALLVPAVAPAAPAADVEIVTLEAQPTIERTVKAKPEALEKAITGAVLSLVACAEQSSLVIVGPPFARYRSRGDAAIEVDIGVAIRRAAAKKLTREIRAGELPAGRAAVLLFRGRHADLPRAHAALDAWLADNQQRPGGARWEVFVTNPLLTPDPDAQQTRIVAPLAAAAR